jgi:hypothetical protein
MILSGSVENVLDQGGRVDRPVGSGEGRGCFPVAGLLCWSGYVCADSVRGAGEGGGDVGDARAGVCSIMVAS